MHVLLQKGSISATGLLGRRPLHQIFSQNLLLLLIFAECHVDEICLNCLLDDLPEGLTNAHIVFS